MQHTHACANTGRNTGAALLHCCTNTVCNLVCKADIKAEALDALTRHPKTFRQSYRVRR